MKLSNYLIYFCMIKFNMHYFVIKTHPRNFAPQQRLSGALDSDRVTGTFSSPTIVSYEDKIITIIFNNLN